MELDNVILWALRSHREWCQRHLGPGCGVGTVEHGGLREIYTHRHIKNAWLYGFLNAQGDFTLTLVPFIHILDDKMFTWCLISNESLDH
jgi:hypothetical protein